jgi:alanine racemase
VDEEILMLRSTALRDELEKIIEYGAVATVGSYEAAAALNEVAEKNTTTVDAHIEIDTGMGRYGFSVSEYDRVVSVFKYMNALNITGMYTHFTLAFKSEKAVHAQLDGLLEVASEVRKAGFDPGRLHAANSAALFKHPFALLDAVRIGSAFTGRCAAKGKFGLLKTGFAEAKIIEIRWLSKGQTVGYGGDFKCRKPTRVAVAPIGYADGVCVDKTRDIFTYWGGVRAGLSGLKAWFLRKRIFGVINGKNCRVLGHFGMQHCVLDVTGIDCAAGDTVRLEVNPIIAGNILPKQYR